MSESRRGGRYLLLFAVETLGAAMLSAIVVPVYRAAQANPGAYSPKITNIVWAGTGMILMQAGYWTRRRLKPQLPSLRHAVLGHILQFAGSMSFVLATSIFGFVFLTGRLESKLGPSGHLTTLAGLFCWFCYTQELQQLGRSLIGPER